MKKIIKGKRYDTDTAKLICDNENYSNGTLSSWDEIYRKKTGEFFFYHCSTGFNCWDKAKYIKPLTEEKAMEYCEKWMDGDDYKILFGSVEE